MKQYRPLLFIFALMCLLWTLAISTISAQQLKQIQKGTARNQIPATNGLQYTQVYRDAIPYILDTLGIRDTLMGDFPECCLDSIFIDDNNLFYIYEGDTIDVGTITTLTDTTLINQLISDSLATIVFPSDSTTVIAGTAISVNEATPNNWTVTNTAPDQTVTITGATGTYPNFTLPAEIGDISAVTVSAPITGGGTTGSANIALDTTSTKGAATQFDLTLKENPLTFTSPLTRLVNTVSIPAATTSVSGHLTSTDWNTFNGKVGGTGSANKVAYWTGANTQSFNNNLHWDNVNERLGIGTASPLDKLSVNGNTSLNGYLRVNGGNNIWIQNSTQPLPSGAGDQNTIIGFNVGNNTGMAGAINNFLLGTNAAIGLTTGDNNVAIGQGVLSAVSTGSDNVAIGNSALNNTANTATTIGIGANAGKDITTTYGGIYIGSSSGRSSTGWGIALGEQALRFNTGDNSLGLGNLAGYQNTRANSLYIENTNTFSPLIGGQFDNNRVGINTLITDIGRTLDINGEVRIRDLNTTTPTRIVSADADGVLSTLGLSGLSISGGNLTVTATTRDSTIVTGGTGISVNESPLNTFTVTNTGDLSTTNEKINSLTWNDAQDSLQVVENGIIYRTKITGFGTGNGTVTSVAATAGTGISVTGSPITTSGTLNITNTAPDQVVSLTDGGITSITGTYPNFTVTSTEVDGNIGNEYNTGITEGFIGILPSLSITDNGGTFNGKIPLFSTSSSSAGVVPGSDGSTSKFLRADGGWIVPTITEVGDISAVTVSAPVTGGATSGSVNIGVDTTSSTGLFTQYDGTLKQNTLVSGVTIKTVNSNSLLGSGNVSVGTVTSVGIVNGGGLTVSGSPITTSGNITITAADQSASNEYNTSVDVVHVAGNARPRVRVTDSGGTLEGLVPFFETGSFNAGVVIGSNGASNSNFLRADGNWAIPSTGITSLGGQTGATQTFAYGTFGTTPSWSSSTNTHTFRLPLGTNGQVLKHNGTDWTAGADAGALSGTLNTIPYYNSTTSIASTPFTYVANIMTIPTGNSIYFPGTATIIDKNNSGGAANEILSRAASGGGMDWIPAPTLVEVDGSTTNEGFLGVSDGTTTSSIIQGYNSAGTSVGTGVTINAGNGMSISETFSTNGGSITLTADAATFGQMHRTTNISAATFDASSRIVDFTNSLLSPTGVTFSDALDELTVSTTGQYEVTYSLSYRHSGGSLTVTDWAIYKNGVEQYNSRVKQSDDASAYYMTVSKTFIMDITAGSDEIRLHYQRTQGTATSIDINAPVVTLKRLN